MLLTQANNGGNLNKLHSLLPQPNRVTSIAIRFTSTSLFRHTSEQKTMPHIRAERGVFVCTEQDSANQMSQATEAHRHVHPTDSVHFSGIEACARGGLLKGTHDYVKGMYNARDVAKECQQNLHGNPVKTKLTRTNDTKGLRSNGTQAQALCPQVDYYETTGLEVVI